MFKIGNINLKNNIVLAPMAGISNSAYRTIIKEMGCGLIYAEMVSDKAITYGNNKTIEMLYMTDFERPIAQQIFGSDVDSFVTSAKYIYDNMHPDIIDINMGCPVPKVALRAQAGSALLKNPKKVGEIVKAVVEAVPIPVTVKIRSGWDSDSINAVEIAKVIEEAGASAITVHPRTRAQGYAGKADWNIIKQVKDAVKIPVIGNGDVKSALDAKKMLDETGCDAVMIARGSLGNPWIFEQINAYLEKGIVLDNPSIEEIHQTILEHIRLLRELKGDHIATLESRTQVAYYLRGLPKSAEIKRILFTCKTIEEVITLVDNYFLSLN